MPSVTTCRRAPRIIRLRNSRRSPGQRALATLPAAGAAAAGNSDDAMSLTFAPIAGDDRQNARRSAPAFCAGPLVAINGFASGRRPLWRRRRPEVILSLAPE